MSDDRARTTERGPLTVDESAERIRRYLWVESRLFEVLGVWVPSVPELEAKVLVATHARRRATHADLWRQRLPDRRGAAADRFGDPPSPAMATFMEALAAPSAPGQTIEKLVGVYRVALPNLIDAYTRHRARSNMVSDRPTARALELALADDVRDLRDGEPLLYPLIGSAAATERADRHRARLDGLLFGAGGIGGDGSARSGPEAGENPRHLE